MDTDRDKTSLFIAKALKVHGENLFFDKVVYDNNKKHVVVTCKIHGDYEATPANILKGRGCPACARINRGMTLRKSSQQFREEVESILGDRLDFSKTNYVTAKQKVTVICPSHGEFTSLPQTLLLGRGCDKCASEELSVRYRMGKEKFTRRAEEMHGKGTFDYSRVNYINVDTKVEIRCNHCGEFFYQTPWIHFGGSGCTNCNPLSTGFDPSRMAVLYVYEISGDDKNFTGFGITARYAYRKRTHLRNLGRSGLSVEREYVTEELPGEDVLSMERQVLEKFSNRKVETHVIGFIRENTYACFEDVVNFVKEMENSNESLR